MLLYRDTVNTVYLTLKEGSEIYRQSGITPTYLLQILDTNIDFTVECLPVYVSGNSVYDVLRVTLTGFTGQNLTAGTISLQDNTIYHYNVYEQSSQTNLVISGTTGQVVETGVVQVHERIPIEEEIIIPPCTEITYELITNGDFENADTNWTYVYYGGQPAMDISNSLMNLTAQGSASVDGFYQTFSLDETKTYTISGIATRDYNGLPNTEGVNIEFWGNSGNHYLTTLIPTFADDFAQETTFSFTVSPTDWIGGATYLRDTYGLPSNLTGFIISSNGTYLLGFHLDNLSMAYTECI